MAAKPRPEPASTAATSADDPSLLVRGVSPVLEVPFTSRGDVDYDGFENVVRYVLSTGVTSLMFPGFASEFYKLSETERTRLTQLLLRYTTHRPDVAAIVAVQDHATLLAVRRAQEAVAEGADLINLLPPHFLSPSRPALLRHVQTVLSAIEPTPVVLQYAPSETGTSLDADTLHSLATEHPNLRLLKVESSPPGRLITELHEGGAGLPAVEGYAGVQLPDAIRRGAVGTQPGCSFTEVYLEIWRRFARDDEAGGVRLHTKLLPYVSYWMLDPELIIAAEKAISVRRGLFDSPYCREPAHHLDVEELRMVDRFLDDFGDLLPELSREALAALFEPDGVRPTMSSPAE